KVADHAGGGEPVLGGQHGFEVGQAAPLRRCGRSVCGLHVVSVFFFFQSAIAVLMPSSTTSEEGGLTGVKFSPIRPATRPVMLPFADGAGRRIRSRTNSYPRPTTKAPATSARKPTFRR